MHIPVMAREVVELLGGSVEATESPSLFVDATLGAGGHTALLLKEFSSCTVLGTDQDPAILDVARERLRPLENGHALSVAGSPDYRACCGSSVSRGRLGSSWMWA